MKTKETTTLLLFLAALSVNLSAQTIPDTIWIHKWKFRFIYEGQTIRRPGPLGLILSQEPVDPQVKRIWNQYNTIRDAGIGLEAVGVGLMGINLIQTLRGNDSPSLLLAGAGSILAGVVVNAFVATPRAKAAAKRYNDQKLGRIPSAAPPRQADLVDTLSGKVRPETSNSVFRQEVQRNEHSNGAYLGFSFGPAWSKQHINYAFAIDEEFKTAGVFSFGAMYGRRISDNLGWQFELGLTEHGYRIEKTATNSGVRIDAKSDVQLRYLELSPSLVYSLLEFKGLELAVIPGLDAGYALSGRIVTLGEGENETRRVRTHVTDKLSLEEATFADRLNAAIRLGIQVSYPLPFGSAFLETRYHYGLLNLDRNSEFSLTDSGDKTYNRTLLLRLGTRFAL